MLIYKVALVTMFGRGASHLLGKVYWRMAPLCLAATSLGISLSSQISHLPLFSTPGPMPLLCCIFLVQLTSLGVLLGAYSQIRSSQDVFLRLLIQLPVKSFTVWLVSLLPGCVLSFIGLLLVVPTLYSLLVRIQLQPWLPLVLALGWFSALGIVYGVRRNWLYLTFLGASSALWGEYRLIAILFNSQGSSPTVHLATTAFLGIICLGLGLLIYSRRLLLREITQGQRLKKVKTTVLPPIWWTIKKVSRSQHTRSGFWITLLMGTLIAVVGQKFGGLDIAFTGGIVSLLAAAFCSDLRRATRCVQPPEIIGLKGTLYFLTQQWATAIITVLAAILPLLILSLTDVSGKISAPAVIHMCVSILLGVSAGICASTLFATQARDISAQASATLVAIGCSLLPELGWVAVFSESQQTLLSIGLVLACGMGTYTLENHRNNYKWRKNYVSKI